MYITDVNENEVDKMKIENIYIKRDAEGNIAGDIEISKNGRFDCVSFGLYTSGNFEFKTWNTRKFTKEEKKALDIAALAKLAA